MPVQSLRCWLQQLWAPWADTVLYCTVHIRAYVGELAAVQVTPQKNNNKDRRMQAAALQDIHAPRVRFL